MTPNIRKVKEFLAWECIHDNETYYNEIRKIAPGSITTITKEKLTFQHFSIFEKNNDRYSFSDQGFKEVFETAVNKRARKFNKLGLMLSGGLDSSSIAIALLNTKNTNTHTLSANFSHLDIECETDEKNYQENIYNATGFGKTNLEMKDISVLKDIEKYINIFQEPILIPNLYIFESICNEAKKMNFDAILDGNDGDNVISHGYETFYEKLLRLDLINFYRSVDQYSAINKKNKRRMLIFFLKSFVKKLINFKSKESNNSFLRENFYRNIGKAKKLNILDSHKTKLLNHLHYVAFENRFKIFNELGIESVSPFYDKDLINYCLEMPSEFKYKDGFSRSILRKYLKITFHIIIVTVLENLTLQMVSYQIFQMKI